MPLPVSHQPDAIFFIETNILRTPATMPLFQLAMDKNQLYYLL